jgi:hypothetical protein
MSLRLSWIQQSAHRNRLLETMFYQDNWANDRLSRQGTRSWYNWTFFVPTHDSYKPNGFSHASWTAEWGAGQVHPRRPYARLRRSLTQSAHLVLNRYRQHIIETPLSLLLDRLLGAMRAGQRAPDAATHDTNDANGAIDYATRLNRLWT